MQNIINALQDIIYLSKYIYIYTHSIAHYQVSTNEMISNKPIERVNFLQ